MIASLNSRDTIKTISANKFRSHRLGVFWIGDYCNYADAKRALQIANSPGADQEQKGFYDGGVKGTYEKHMTEHRKFFGEMWGHCNCVTQDAVNRTILAGEFYWLQGGFPIKVK